MAHTAHIGSLGPLLVSGAGLEGSLTRVVCVCVIKYEMLYPEYEALKVAAITVTSNCVKQFARLHPAGKASNSIFG